MLSVTTGRLCCDIGEVYEILNHVTGDNLYTHVLPRANRFAAPLLLADFPELAPASACLSNLDGWIEADKTPDRTECIKMWLTELKSMFPVMDKDYLVKSHASEWNSRNPLDELQEMVGPEKVIVAEI